mmetsp:Transcript_17657/g.43471  ORF Transcript_17657/g.43471 Transcript_17657/m.43471 type:complete len:387 (+) Transcript_17657:1837-2997(+)
MTHRCTNAICSSISTTNDNDILASSSDPVVLFPLRLEGAFLGHEELLLVHGEEFHGKVNSLQVPSRNRQVTWLGGTQTQTESIKVVSQVINIDIDTNVGIGDKFNAFFSQQIDTTIDGFLFQLHVWNSIHQKSSNTIGPFKDGNIVSLLVQLIGSRQSRRTRSHHSHGKARAFLRNPGSNLSIPKGSIDNGIFHILDGNRRINQSSHTRSLARCWTDTSSKLGKVVGGMQPFNGFVPLILIDQIVPFGNQVVDGTSLMSLTKGSSAIHATSGLNLAFNGRVGDLDVSVWDRINLFPVIDAFEGITVWLGVALVIQETTEFFNGFDRAIAAADFWLIVMIVDSFSPNFMTTILGNWTRRIFSSFCALCAKDLSKVEWIATTSGSSGQ